MITEYSGENVVRVLRRKTMKHFCINVDPWKRLFRNRLLWKYSVVWGSFFEVLLSNFEAVCKIRKATVSWVMFLCLSLRLSSNLSLRKVPRLLLEGFSWHLIFFEKKIEKLRVPLKSDKITGTGHDDQCTRIIISRSFILRTRDVSDKFERKSKHILFHNLSKIVPFMRKCGKIL